MTGLDFSPTALEQARRLATRVGADIDYVQATVDDALDVLPAGEFELVFTGIGALCWLPDVRRCARIVATLLRPGGRLFIREGHPALWSLDETREGGLVIDYPYFELAEPMVFDEPGTFVETDHEFLTTRTPAWNHGLAEVVTAVLDAGLQLTVLVEHDSVPGDALRGKMEQLPNGEYRLLDRPWRLPHTYTLQAVKQSRLAQP